MPDSTLKSLRAAVALSPDNTPLLLLYGSTAMDSWNLEEARTAFENVLRVDPANPEAQTGIARIFFKMGNIPQAMVRVEAILARNPHDADTRLLLSRLWAAQGRLEEARRQYDELVATAPELKDPVFEQVLYAIAQPVPPPTASSGQPRVKTTGTPSLESDIDTILRSIENQGEARSITFNDIGGMEAVKQSIRMKVLNPLLHPELYEAYGQKTRGEVLLYGPPGCGKRLFCRAIAGEINATFIPLSLHDILDMQQGKGEMNLHELFQTARANVPSLLFIDDIDAVTADSMHLARSLTRQFLAELDGITSSNNGVVIMAASSAPWNLDPEIRRKKRFERNVFVPPPDAGARVAILQILARKKPCDSLDFDKIAGRTEHFSGTDLRLIFDRSTETVLSRAMQHKRIIPLTTRDLIAALKSIKPSTRSWFEKLYKHAQCCNRDGFYDDALTYPGIS